MAETQTLMERLESAVVKLELLLSNAHKVAGIECGTVNGVDGGMISVFFWKAENFKCHGIVAIFYLK